MDSNWLANCFHLCGIFYPFSLAFFSKKKSVPASWQDCGWFVAETRISKTPSFSILDLHPTPSWVPETEKNKGRPSGRLHSDAQVSRQKTLCTSVSEHRNCGALKARNCILTNFSLVLKSLVRTVRKLANDSSVCKNEKRTSLNFQKSLYTLGFSAVATCHLWLKRNSTWKALRRCNPT